MTDLMKNKLFYEVSFDENEGMFTLIEKLSDCIKMHSKYNLNC